MSPTTDDIMYFEIMSGSQKSYSSQKIKWQAVRAFVLPLDLNQTNVISSFWYSKAFDLNTQEYHYLNQILIQILAIEIDY